MNRKMKHQRLDSLGLAVTLMAAFYLNHWQFALFLHENAKGDHCAPPSQKLIVEK
jgi:hypothetical protein